MSGFHHQALAFGLLTVHRSTWNGRDRAYRQIDDVPRFFGAFKGDRHCTIRGVSTAQCIPSPV